MVRGELPPPRPPIRGHGMLDLGSRIAELLDEPWNDDFHRLLDLGPDVFWMHFGIQFIRLSSEACRTIFAKSITTFLREVFTSALTASVRALIARSTTSSP